MIHFENDYSAGTHPDILKALADSNLEGNAGYGLDSHTREAEQIILNLCGGFAKSVFFLAGGTQTNAVALDWLCRPGEGVLAAETAHINVHESGAIEASGHKVITLSSEAGKLRAADIRDYMTTFYADPTWPHMVSPAAVYVSQPTELGTLYSLEELEEISAVCHEFGMKLYLDGARLIYALASPRNNLDLRDISRLADMFYIGGTKCGTLYGEALVTRISDRRNQFFSHIKRHGALLAKGWLAAVQFKALFSDGLYQEIGARGVGIAARLAEVLREAGCRELVESPTNQIFFELTEVQIRALQDKVVCDCQSPLGPDRRMVRFVADWSNTKDQPSEVARLLSDTSVLSGSPMKT